MDRRNKSVDRYYKDQEEKTKKAQSTIYNMEKAAIDNQMALEKHQRKIIGDKKN
jgi:uridine kinase